MPELPEVEIMCRRLDRLIGASISNVTIVRQNGKYLNGYEHFFSETQPFVQHVFRRGKYIILQMNTGECLICHNSMSGYWDFEDDPWTFDYVEGKRKKETDDIRVVFDVNIGQVSTKLRFRDTRLFGSLRMHPSPIINGLGPEIMRTSHNPDDVEELMLEDLEQARDNCPDAMIKSVLLDQSIVAGIGNIYVTEGLWHAGIRPDTSMRILKDDDLWDVMCGVRQSMRDSLEGGIDYSSLMIYRKNVCSICETKTTVIQIDKRSSYFCEICQRTSRGV